MGEATSLYMIQDISNPYIAMKNIPYALHGDATSETADEICGPIIWVTAH